jgi:acyl carrier protein
MDRLEMIACITMSLSEVLEHDVPEVSEDTRLMEDLNMDSTSVLELLMALEDNAGFEVDASNLNMDDFKTVGTLADYFLRAATPVSAL